MNIEEEITKLEKRLQELRESLNSPKKLYILSELGRQLYTDSSVFNEGEAHMTIKTDGKGRSYADYIAIEDLLLSGKSVTGRLDPCTGLICLAGFYFEKELLEESK